MKITIEESESSKWIFDTNEDMTEEFREHLIKHADLLLGPVKKAFLEAIEKDELIIHDVKAVKK